MIKKYWKTLVFTSILILLPIVASLILWNKLPDPMPSHWNAQGEVDGWASKFFVVFGLPGILLAAHWLCTLATAADPKKANHSEKVLQLVWWILPVLSNVLFTVVYCVALGISIPMEVVMPLFVGMLFVIIGNYMPKCKQNYTIGIKIPWTLNSEENWNKTHRFAGWVWSIGGVVIMLMAFFGNVWIFMGAILPMVLLPVVYSFILHKKGI